MEKNSSENITLTLGFYGGVRHVTGANFVLGDDNTLLMVDCGIKQDENLCDECNTEPFPYESRDITALCVTHAHMDHIGRIPQLVRDGFTGPIYMTHPTKDLMELSLVDGAHIAALEAKERSVEPPYTLKDVGAVMKQVKALSYKEEVRIGAFEVTLLPAGHILGSAVVHAKHAPSKRVVLFSGDLGNPPHPLLESAPDIFDATHIVLETVYGNRTHIPHDARRDLLLKKLKSAIRRGGAVLIPAFSISRTQVLLYELSRMMRLGDIPRVPIFLDSPLAINVTDVYERYPEYFHTEAQAERKDAKDLFGLEEVIQTPTKEESSQIAKEKNPKIIIAGAGMSHGGRIQEHEARYLGDPNTTLLIPGYQAVGTFGRRLLEGEKRVRINGRWIEVRATVEQVDGYSAHGDQSRLLDFVLPSVESGALKKVFLAMGELGASMHMAQKIHDFTGIPTAIPEEGQVYTL